MRGIASKSIPSRRQGGRQGARQALVRGDLDRAVLETGTTGLGTERGDIGLKFDFLITGREDISIGVIKAAEIARTGARSYALCVFPSRLSGDQRPVTSELEMACAQSYTAFCVGNVTRTDL